MSYSMRCHVKKCPECQSPNIVADDFNSDGEQVWHDVTCMDCECTWREFFSFLLFEIL